VDPTTRRWFLELEAIVSEFDYLPDEDIGFRLPTERKFAWAHASPVVSMRFRLDERHRKRFRWRTGFPEVSTEAGRHEVPAPYGNPYVRLSYTLDESALDLQDGFAISSLDGRSVTVPVVFRVEPLRPVADWETTVGVVALRPLGGSVRVAISGDGETWSREVETDPEGGSTQVLVIDPSQTRAVSGEAPLWIRVALRATAGKKTNTASRITYVEVSASLAAEE
jgi:hypothetical protein